MGWLKCSNVLCGHQIGINLSWEIRQEAERSVGAREVVVFPQDTSEMNRYAGDASVPTPHPRPLPPLRMLMGLVFG